MDMKDKTKCVHCLVSIPMASIMKRGDSYSVRYKYKDHSGKPCEGWESFKTRKEAQERKITVEKELLDGTFLEKFYATLAKTPCGQYVHGVKQTLTDKQKKRLLSSTSIHEVHTLLKTDFSYAVEWDLIHKIPLPREAPKANSEERTIWDEKTMLAALQTIENPALHLAVHLSMILSLRKGEILGLQPSDLDFDAADGRGTILVNKTMQRANKDALEKLDPNQVYHTFPGRREGSKSSLITRDLTPAAPQQPPESKQPAATKISGKEILEAIRLMDAEERRELTRVLFA